MGVEIEARCHRSQHLGGYPDFHLTMMLYRLGYDEGYLIMSGIIMTSGYVASRLSFGFFLKPT